MAGKLQLGSLYGRAAVLFFSPLMMSTGDELVAKALNSCRNEGMAHLGGADRLALEELLSEFIATGSDQPPDSCKLYSLMNNANNCNQTCVLGDEDFDSHYQGFQDDTSKMNRQS